MNTKTAKKQRKAIRKEVHQIAEGAVQDAIFTASRARDKLFLVVIAESLVILALVGFIVWRLV